MQARGRRMGAWFLAAAAIVGGAGLSGCSTQDSENGEAYNQAPPRQESNLEQAASVGLATLKQLAAGPDAGLHGLREGDAANATLGQKYDVYMIGLDRLRDYQAGGSATNLLARTPDTLFPVLVNGEVRSSITVTQESGGFTASAVGAVPSIQAASRTERSPDDFLVRVPALGFEFIGRRADGRVFLVLTTPDPRLRLRAGAETPAETVLEQLVPIAQAYNGEPM